MLFSSILGNVLVRSYNSYVFYRCTGEVVSYCPASNSQEKALYHILWSDGDEQDYDFEDLQKGTLVVLYALIYCVCMIYS